MMNALSLVLLFVAAIAMQSPWWCVSTAADYFASSFPGYNAEFAFGVAYAVGIAVALAINLASSNVVNMWAAGFLGFLFEAGGLAVVMCSQYISDSYGVNASYWAVVASVSFSNFGSAIVANSLYSLFAPLHHRAALVIQIGGVTCALINGLLRVAFYYTAQSAAGLAFFVIALAFVLLGMVSFLFLFLRRRSTRDETMYQSLQLQTTSAESKAPSIGWGATFFSVWRPLVALMVDFTMLFICYPGLLSVIHCHASTQFVVWSFMAFNTSDAVGKFLPLLKLPPISWTFVLSVGEAAVFLTLFAGSLGLNQLNQTIFGSQAYALVLTSLLGLTHGYLCASCFVLAPHHASPDSKARAGSLTYVFNTAGIILGTAVSLVFPLIFIPRVC